MPKRKAPMTVAEVAKLGPGNHRVGGVAGLVLQVSKTGSGRSWTLRYTDANENRREIGIGSAFEIPLQLARDKALQLRQAHRLDGVDPLQARADAKRTAIAEAVASVTFAEAVEGYLKSRDGTWGNEKHAGQWATTLERYAVPTLGQMSVGAIQPTHVAEALRSIWQEKPETAHRTRQRVEVVISYADTLAGRQRPNPARLRGSLDQLLPKVSRTVEHHAAMPWRDLPGFMRKLSMAEGAGARALAFLIQTVARTGEVIGATWAEIEGNVWTIPASRMKAGREHAVPLTPAAVALLGERGKDSALVFPGVRGRPMSAMTMAMVLKRLQVDCTVHGMRSSFRDWCGATGQDRELAERALAHDIGNAVERAYARDTLLDRRRDLMLAWSGFLAG